MKNIYDAIKYIFIYLKNFLLFFRVFDDPTAERLKLTFNHPLSPIHFPPPQSGISSQQIGDGPVALYSCSMKRTQRYKDNPCTPYLKVFVLLLLIHWVQECRAFGKIGLCHLLPFHPFSYLSMDTLPINHKWNRVLPMYNPVRHANKQTPISAN